MLVQRVLDGGGNVVAVVVAAVAVGVVVAVVMAIVLIVAVMRHCEETCMDRRSCGGLVCLLSTRWGLGGEATILSIVSLAYINTDEAVIITSRQEPGSSDIDGKVRSGNLRDEIPRFDN